MSQTVLAALPLSLAAGGVLLGAASARAVPPALGPAATLAAAACALLLLLSLLPPRALSLPRAAAGARPAKEGAGAECRAPRPESGAGGCGAPSSVGTSGSDSEGSDGGAGSGSDGSAGPRPGEEGGGREVAAPSGPAAPRGRPPATIRISLPLPLAPSSVPPPPATISSSRSDSPPPATIDTPPPDIPPPPEAISTPPPPPPPTARLPLQVRVEQERRRIRGSGKEASVAATATAHCLRFRDADGRRIRYTVRTSRRRGSAAFLEARVEGQRPRKAKCFVYHAPSKALHDGKLTYAVPEGDAALVLRGLALLCKVCAVPLERLDAGPGIGPAPEPEPGPEPRPGPARRRTEPVRARPAAARRAPLPRRPGSLDLARAPPSVARAVQARVARKSAYI